MFVEAEMAGMNGDAVVVVLASFPDQNPISFLFTKIQSRSIGDEDAGQEKAGQTEPSNDVKLGLIGDVIVNHGRSEGTEFTTGCRETVGRGSNGSGIEFGGKEERGGVRSELLPEGGKHVEEREGFDRGSGLLEFIEFEGADDKNDKNDEKSYGLHPNTAVESMIDKKRCHIVADKRDPDVQEVPVPSSYDGCSGIKDLDESAGKDFGSVEEEVVAEPVACRSYKTMPVMTEDELQRFDVITGDIIPLLG